MLIGIVFGCSALLSALLCVATGAFGSLAWLWLLPAGFLGSVLLLALLAFLFLWAACASVRMDVPQEKDSPFFRRLLYLYMDAIITLGRVHIHAQGLEKTPADGRFLLVCNHTHDTDPIALLAAFRKQQLTFISKRELDSRFLVGKLMHKILCQPINRENDREALKTIIKCIRLIQEDVVSIGVFPEGYIKPDRKLHPFRSGVFKIAQRANVPIVVCTLRGTYEALPKVLKFRSPEITMHLVGVIPAEELQEATATQIAERVYQMMADDLGPGLVNQEEKA